MSTNYEHHEEATATYEEGAIKVHATIKEPEELKDLISSLYTAGDLVGF